MKLNLPANWLLRSMAVSLACNMLLPVGVAWAADEIQIIRNSIAHGGKAAGVLPFSTFQQEQMALAAALPCKWISKDGRLGPSYGGQRYDFLCKGGDFATVSLFMNKGSGDGIGSVKLLYREWAESANPNAGEAAVAQQFLQYMVGRFVPAAKAGDVMDAFWSKGSRSWSDAGLKIGFQIDKTSDRGVDYVVRKLEITGTGKAVAPQVVPMIPVPSVPVKPYVMAPDSGLTKPGETRLMPGVSPVRTPAITPTDAGLSKPVVPEDEAKPVLTTPGILPLPGVGTTKGGPLVVPITAPAGGVQPPAEKPVQPEEKGTLEKATPAELNTAPAPESKAVPAAPPEISTSLVPTAEDLAVGSRAKAPSNFDAYNRAVELTKDIEKKAQITKVEEAKVTASKPGAASGYVTPSTVLVPPLKPVNTPSIDDGTGTFTPANTAGEGLGVTPKLEGDAIGQPENYNGPRRTEVRPLPQLKFVPKAEPLKSGDEVIQFEDEKSKL